MINADVGQQVLDEHCLHVLSVEDRTGWFDAVCYPIGISKRCWLSDFPFKTTGKTNWMFRADASEHTTERTDHWNSVMFPICTADWRAEVSPPFKRGRIFNARRHQLSIDVLHQLSCTCFNCPHRFAFASTFQHLSSQLLCIVALLLLRDTHLNIGYRVDRDMHSFVATSTSLAQRLGAPIKKKTFVSTLPLIQDIGCSMSPRIAVSRQRFGGCGITNKAMTAARQPHIHPGLDRINFT